MEYTTRKVLEARRFAGLTLPDDVARKLRLLRLSAMPPAPLDPQERAELAQILNAMKGTYGKGKYCPDRKAPLYPLAEKKAKVEAKAQKSNALGPVCLDLQDLSRVLDKSRSWDELIDAWRGWHSVGPQFRHGFRRYVELSGKGAKAIGFADLGEMWRSGYDKTPPELEAEVERLWQEVRPMYEQLHCLVRARLRKKYGDRVPERGPIPAHLFGNMWAQDWAALYDLLTPYPDQPKLDIDARLQKNWDTGGWDAKRMVRIGEDFFVSLGLERLPETFWGRSLFVKPRDREVVCHASAWDIDAAGDVRVKCA